MYHAVASLLSRLQVFVRGLLGEAGHLCLCRHGEREHAYVPISFCSHDHGRTVLYLCRLSGRG